MTRRTSLKTELLGLRDSDHVKLRSPSAERLQAERRPLRSNSSPLMKVSCEALNSWLRRRRRRRRAGLDWRYRRRTRFGRRPLRFTQRR